MMRHDTNCLQQELVYAIKMLFVSRERSTSKPSSDVRRKFLKHLTLVWRGEWYRDSRNILARFKNLTQDGGSLDRNGKIAQEI